MNVSCVCCTYGRFELLRRSLAFFLWQDYPTRELIIFNTGPVPIEYTPSPTGNGTPVVRVVNQAHETGHPDRPYRSLGKVREDALEHASGTFYACWDDDDMFLPWHLSQAIDGVLQSGRPAWMPARSYFSTDGGGTFELARNSMEASVLVSIEEVRRYGFSHASGSEHLPWRRGLVDAGKLSENDDVHPFHSYAYIWGDGRHKTSGHIDAPDNFEAHQFASQDFGNGSLLTPAPESETVTLLRNIARSNPDPRLARRLQPLTEDRMDSR